MNEPTRLSVSAEERDHPDLRLLARALIDLAISQAEEAKAARPADDGPADRPEKAA